MKNGNKNEIEIIEDTVINLSCSAENEAMGSTPQARLNPKNTSNRIKLPKIARNEKNIIVNKKFGSLKIVD